jgi:hypothetical protein
MKTECLNWTNPRTTGIIYASINLLLFSSTFSASILAPISNFLLILFLLSTGIAFFLDNNNKDNDLNKEYSYIPKESIETFFRNVYESFILLSNFFKKVTSLESPLLTIQTLIGLYVSTVITSNVCSCLIVFLSINFFFILGLALKYKGEELCKGYNKITGVICDSISKISNKIPKYEVKGKKN